MSRVSSLAYFILIFFALTLTCTGLSFALDGSDELALTGDDLGRNRPFPIDGGIVMIRISGGVNPEVNDFVSLEFLDRNGKGVLLVSYDGTHWLTDDQSHDRRDTTFMFEAAENSDSVVLGGDLSSASELEVGISRNFGGTVDQAALIISGMSIGLSAFSSLLTKRVVYTPDFVRKRKMTTEWRKEYQQAQKSKDKKKIKRLEKVKGQMTKIESKAALQSFKTWPLTIVPFMLAFFWMSSTFGYLHWVILSPVALPLVGRQLAFFPWYLLSSFGFSTILRKVLRL